MSKHKELYKSIYSLLLQIKNCQDEGNVIWEEKAGKALAVALSKIEPVSNVRVGKFSESSMILDCQYAVLNRQMELVSTDVRITVTADLTSGITVKAKQTGDVIPSKLFNQCHKATLEASVRSSLIAQCDQYSFYI